MFGCLTTRLSVSLQDKARQGSAEQTEQERQGTKARDDKVNWTGGGMGILCVSFQLLLG